jgi:hypothetical protein
MSVSVIAFIGMAAVLIIVFAASIIMDFNIKLKKSHKIDSTKVQDQEQPASLVQCPIFEPDPSPAPTTASLIQNS